MIFSKIKSGLKEAIIVSGYTRTAKELSFLSDRQLADLGISRELLSLGAKAYPWRAEVIEQVIPDNVTNFNTLQSFTYVPTDSGSPKTPKAA